MQFNFQTATYRKPHHLTDHAKKEKKKDPLRYWDKKTKKGPVQRMAKERWPETNPRLSADGRQKKGYLKKDGWRMWYGCQRGSKGRMTRQRKVEISFICYKGLNVKNIYR